MKEDFTNKYNTPLSVPEEEKFQAWAKQESTKRNYDVTSDLSMYDLRGMWKEYGGYDANGHGNDKFKKPNHPTFSKESKFNGADGYFGGEWKEDNEGHLSFVASNTNQKFYKRKTLEKIFQKYEPGVSLVFDDGEQALANQMFYSDEQE
ncbi:hypothetical protein [Cloacibacillus evryensis]|uniref:DUF3991 domain-containing protein n=1 Tax=Cloacibacillus evryensis TaxID=508460 RepID=A0AAW5JZD7_9BACT|nr:hypothetical protein [Cloacibacillus evryensis]MCQ4813567.1 hypothetical protein [Cloacibacillus evryensis]